MAKVSGGIAVGVAMAIQTSSVGAATRAPMFTDVKSVSITCIFFGLSEKQEQDFCVSISKSAVKIIKGRLYYYVSVAVQPMTDGRRILMISTHPVRKNLNLQRYYGPPPQTVYLDPSRTEVTPAIEAALNQAF